eukprot:945970-Amphidinium_carterae.1
MNKNYVSLLWGLGGSGGGRAHHNARPTSSAVLMGAASSLFTAPDEQRGTGTRQPSRTAATGQSGQRSA